jgi:selenide,water dikinase
MARLNREAAEEMVALGASAATDITGYGLAGHGWGMALGSKLSLRFFASEIPYYPKSLELIRLGVDTKLTISNRESVGENIHFSEDLDDAMKMLFLDPQTSGGLLISITKSKGEELVSRLHERGVTEAIIVGETYAASRPSIEVTTKRYSNR